MADELAPSRAYASALRTLFAPDAPTARRRTQRGASGPSTTVLLDRIDDLLVLSDRNGAINAGMAQDGSDDEREAGEIKLLVQASAELRIAATLLDLGDEATDAPVEAASRAVAITRGGERSALVSAFDDWAGVLEGSVAQTLKILNPASSRGNAAGAVGTKDQLRAEVKATLDYVTNRAAKVSARAVGDLVNMDYAFVSKGLATIGQHIPAVDDVLKGLGGLVKRIVKGAAELLLRAFRWVLSLLGDKIAKDLKDKLDGWIKELKSGKSDPGSFVETIITAIYGVDAIRAEVNGTVDKSSASGETLGRTATEVRALADGFHSKGDLADSTLGGAAFVAKFASGNPAIMAIIAGIRIVLLGYVIYLGYDYVDSNRIRAIPDRVHGVREIISDMK